MPRIEKLTFRRFPIVAGLRVEWDHRNPPGQRVKSIHLVNPGDEDDEDDDDDEEGESPEDLIEFVEQEDGTRVEVKQRKIELGDEVKNEEGGRVYRVVSVQRRVSRIKLGLIARTDHARVHGGRIRRVPSAQEPQVHHR